MAMTALFSFQSFADVPKESVAALVNEIGANAEVGWAPAAESVQEGIEETAGQTFEELAAAEEASTIRSRVVAYAKQFVGRPYQFGGSSLTNGTDCSGFTMRVMQNFGISLSRDSRSQAAGVRRVSADTLQPGDLIFYASGGRINHVALYIGNGQIVHAANEQTGITISSMYYRTPYLMGSVL